MHSHLPIAWLCLYMALIRQSNPWSLCVIYLFKTVDDRTGERDCGTTTFCMHWRNDIPCCACPSFLILFEIRKWLLLPWFHSFQCIRWTPFEWATWTWLITSRHLSFGRKIRDRRNPLDGTPDHGSGWWVSLVSSGAHLAGKGVTPFPMFWRKDIYI